MAVLTHKQKVSRMTEENPFYNKTELLALYHATTLSPTAIIPILEKAAASCKTLEEFQLLFILIFNIGDVTNREHTLLTSFLGAGKVDQGGNSQRRTFIACLAWMVKKYPTQFYQLLPLIHEYTNFENLFYYQVRTDRKKGRINEIISIIPPPGEARETFIHEVTQYLTEVIKDSRTPEFKLKLIAKFLNVPRFSKRSRKNKKGEKVQYAMQQETFNKEVFEAQFAKELSLKMGWDIVVHPSNVQYTGLKSFKQLYNSMNEDVLFSTKRIFNLNRSEFLSWYDSLPSGARYRVGKRLDFKPEVYAEQVAWKKEWESHKEEASKKARVLEAKENLTDSEKGQLKVLQKEAKVTTGATNLFDVIMQILEPAHNSSDLSLVADTLLRTINIEVPVLVIADTSSSMNQDLNSNNSGYGRATPGKAHVIDFASLLTTVMLLKNPEPEAKNMLFTFDDTCNIYVDGSNAVQNGSNRFMQGSQKTISTLVDKSKSFLENYQAIKSILKPKGSTNFSSVAYSLKNWAKQIPDQEAYRKELVNQFQVLLVISDGDMNNSSDATESMRQFQHEMLQCFGWQGVIVVWDAFPSGSKENKFKNLENVMYISSFNPANLNQVFNKIHDFDVIDTFTVLKSIYNSNRYLPVKNAIIKITNMGA